jgi:hypothetical protein
MKKIVLTLLIGMGIICTLKASSDKEFKEHLSREFSISGDGSHGTLFIYNMSGFIKVEGYQGSKVMIEMDKTISADKNEDLETGKKEFKLGYDQRSDTVMVYIAEPFDSRPHRSWHYNDTRNNIEYNYNVDFTVKVPYNMNLQISTVNDGIISVSNVNGNLHIDNVNEGINIKNAKGTTYAHTINGEVTVNYLSNPPEESSYYTINGDIKVTYQAGLSADLHFKSMNGDFFTDFPEAVSLPASVTKTEGKKGSGIVYQLNSSTSIRLGKGGRIFKFETLNGNVYIKKQS